MMHAYRCPSDSVLISVLPSLTPAYVSVFFRYTLLHLHIGHHRAAQSCHRGTQQVRGRCLGGELGVTGPRSLPSCLSRGPPSSLLSALPGITAWLPWCTMDFACGLMTLSTDASHSTILQVTWACPSISKTPRASGTPPLLAAACCS